MTWLLLIIVLDAGGHKVQMDPTAMDWWTCRKTELRVSAGYADRYDGQDIVGAACIRREAITTAVCHPGRRCLS